jgi:hypothetical protein
VLAQLDRGALPAFGIISQGVHVNGILRRPDGLHLWVGWRSRHKPVAPGQLTFGGRRDPGWPVTRRDAGEGGGGGGIDPARARRAGKAVGRVSYVMATPEGLRRDVLHCYDLELPPDSRRNRG